MELEHLDVESSRLAADLEHVISHHIAKFDEKDYPRILLTCLTAIADKVGWLRHLSTLTEEVTEDRFDQKFWEAAMVSFRLNRDKCESAEH